MVSFVASRRCTKGVPFQSKMVYIYIIGVGPRDRASPHKTLVIIPWGANEAETGKILSTNN